MSDQAPRRRWFQFGLRTLLIAILVVGTCLGLGARRMVERNRLEVMMISMGANGVNANVPVKRLPLLLWLAGAERVDCIYLPAGKFSHAEARQIQKAFPEAEIFLQTDDDCRPFFDCDRAR